MKTPEEATEQMMEAMPFFINPNAMIYISRAIKEAQIEAWNEAIEAAKINSKVIVKATLSERGIWKADYIVDFGLLEKLKK
jgi:hypothetical protein